MFKKLKDRVSSKKGFTLVELIVVIVIILVLAAVMIPNVIKYTKQASEAGTKNAAASMLTEIQVEVGDAYIAAGEAPKKVKFGGVEAVKKDKIYITGKGSGKKAEYVVDGTTGQVTAFGYQDGKHWATWDAGDGWKLDNNSY